MSEPVAAKVLVVEDNRTMLALMQYYLSKDFTVFLAGPLKKHSKCFSGSNCTRSYRIKTLGTA
ncbi:hypothetical protein ACN28S_02590 [Cystobacter fuscus]